MTATAYEDEDGFALVQFESKLNTLIYTGRKSQQGRFFKAAIPREIFFYLARDALKKAEEEKAERGETSEVDVGHHA